MSSLILIDMSALVHPAWHVHTNDPDPNSVSDAVVARARALADGHDHVAICVESGKSFRCEISPAYKAHREAKPEAFYFQYRRAVEILEKDGYTILGAPKFESDDSIATLTLWARSQTPPLDVTICTADKDLLSLIADGVAVYSLTKNVRVGRADVVAKFGVTPEQMRDFLALTGDASDAVTGIPGVGPKTAAKLLLDFGDIAGIYSALKQVPDSVGTPSIRKALAENVAALDVAIKLVSLRHDAPIDCAKILEPRVMKPLTTVNDAEYEEEESPLNTEENFNSETGEVFPKKEVAAAEVMQRPSDAPPATAIQTVSSNDTADSSPVSWDLALEPRNPGQAVALAGKLFNSRMFAGYGNPEAVLSTILLGRELGIGAMGSLRGIHNIKNKHALSADLMAALVLRSGKAKYFTPVKLTKDLATYKTHRIGAPDPIEMTFEFGEAVTAGLVKDDSGWKKWPIDMCKARVVARLARTVYPDICYGLYVTEELEDALRERDAA